MAGEADLIQKTVHAIDSGSALVWIKRGLAVLFILGMAAYYFMHEFRGLATAQAMDQAQIGREIASGHGWKTKVIRPRAVGQLTSHGKNVVQNIQYDTYNAPLPPLLDAFALRAVRGHWQMTTRDLISAPDKAIAAFSILFFLLSVLVLFFVARRLFDARLALLACWLVILCDMLWQYSLSGLPQMFMLLIFNSTLYLLVRAVEAQTSGGRVGLWLLAAAVGFGVLALSHALTFWLIAGALIFIAFYFRPRIWSAVIVLVVVGAMYAPWLVRNLALTGNPAGVAFYSLFADINHPESGIMRRVEFDPAGATPKAFLDKFEKNMSANIGGLVGALGWSVVALMFFASLTHSFKKTETSVVRWLVFTMWIGAMIGMAVYGVTEEQGVASNQLNALFLPIMTCFGLAFLLVQWNRLGYEFAWARIAYISMLFILCMVPLLLELPFLAPPKPALRWPPYVPPYISVLNQWMKPNEIIASDMPWAVAWYADRRSLWLPDTEQRFTEFNDYDVLGGPINGLYLTPISGSRNQLYDVLKGEYKDWATVILRSVDMQKFPLKWATLLGLDNECVFFSDHDRQKIEKPQ
ncbi:MAG: glycosyltransferase family 39 protein [Verrucomicrobiota bacterium]|nr:glycosyltransferase family 39 protein [Verrucomicrobiota bacterium]